MEVWMRGFLTVFGDGCWDLGGDFIFLLFFLKGIKRGKIEGKEDREREREG